MIVSGVIRFPSLAGGLTVRTLRVSIRTVAPADAPDTELAAAVVASDIVVPPSGTTVPFEIPVDLPTGTEVAVRAHADVTGTGRVQVGDLVSTARHLFPAPKLVVPLDEV